MVQKKHFKVEIYFAICFNSRDWDPESWVFTLIDSNSWQYIRGKKLAEKVNTITQ